MNNQLQQEQEQDSPKIGARALGEQIYKIMPTYDLLLEQLEEIRFNAYNPFNKCADQKNKLSKQDYLNTIGIFGSRGTGKSSVLYTLQEELNQNKKGNIILPLIEPDNFGENTKIIGSIVGLLCAVGKNLIDQLKKNVTCSELLCEYFNNGILKPNNPLKQLINETIEYHLYTEHQYREMLIQSNVDLPTHIRKSERLLIPDIEFKKKLMKLIHEIIKVKNAINNNDEIVLIYIFIDDIDLKTTKTRELIEALLQYTNHPNIVTVLSGDYEILTESLTLALLQDDPLQELGLSVYDSLKVLNKVNDYKSSMDSLTILKRKTDLAHEYLKKIIPPARRHQLIKWSEETLPNFAFKDDNLLKQLKRLMGSWSIFNYEEMDQQNNKRIDRAINRSYVIFDERPRGIVNAYYHLHQLNKVLQKNEELNVERKFQLVKVFIDTLIMSNSKLLPHQDFIFEKFLLWGSDAKSTVIKYEILEEWIQDQKEIIKNEDKQEILKLIQEPNISKELIRPLYVIGEMIQYLFKPKNAVSTEISYSVEAYFNWKKKVVDSLLIKNDELKIENYTVTENFEYYQSVNFRLFYLAEALSLFATPKLSMLLIELILKSNFSEYYYKTQWDSNEVQLKDEFFIRIVAEVLKKEEQALINKEITPEEQLLTTLYQQSKYSQNEYAKKLANYGIIMLQELCTKTEASTTVERQFRTILEVWDSKLQKQYKKTDDFSGGVRNYGEFLRIIRKRSLFVNFLQKVIKTDMTKKTAIKVKKESIGNQLEKINTATKNNQKMPETVVQTIDNGIRKFAENLIDKIIKENNSSTDSKFYISIEDLNEKDVEKFNSGESGNSLTKYAYAKWKFETSQNNNQNLTFEMYNELLNNIEELSENNKVWYGQYEARTFLPKLRNAAYFPTDSFTEEENFIIEQYAIYVGTDATEVSFNEYEEAKKIVYDKLNQAIENINKEVKLEIEEYGFELSDLDTEGLSEAQIDQLQKRNLDNNDLDS
ncbi:hypothetical protein [Paenibacillus shenyangensis]|uniref:hypothetical protein n=1 Tax=Paenibacillus sp. A9 TaxID=1284352 RepID=UPI000363CBE1|nr:hypothetical protein [Paenibacillus sp. A9]